LFFQQFLCVISCFIFNIHHHHFAFFLKKTSCFSVYGCGCIHGLLERKFQDRKIFFLVGKLFFGYFSWCFIKVYIYGWFKEPLNIGDISHWLSIGNEMLGENTLKRVEVVVTLYYFLGVPCLNFNHVIIMKDINNFFCILWWVKTQKMTKNIYSFILIDMMLKYICEKRM
jgi:hypothetical protein